MSAEMVVGVLNETPRRVGTRVVIDKLWVIVTIGKLFPNSPPKHLRGGNLRPQSLYMGMD